VEVEPGRAIVDGVPVGVHFAPIPGTPLYHLLLGGESWTLAVQALDGVGRWALGVVGERIEVEVVDESSRQIQELAGRPHVRTGAETVEAPMPGLVVRIPVVEGQRVTAGTGLIVVEAMKMENELRAPRTAVVTRVHVTVGDAVERGAALVTIDSSAEASEPRG
jgi:pyruvate carboxylase subunit B